MKMLLIIYSGVRSRLVPELLESHGASGWTEVSQGHGIGVTGRHEGSRAWPGDSAVYFSIASEESAAALGDALRTEADGLEPGERLHVALLPVENFF